MHANHRISFDQVIAIVLGLIIIVIMFRLPR